MTCSRDKHIARSREATLIYVGMNMIMIRQTSRGVCGKQSPPPGLGPAQGSDSGHSLEQSLLHNGRDMTQAAIEISDRVGRISDFNSDLQL